MLATAHSPGREAEVNHHSNKCLGDEVSEEGEGERGDETGEEEENLKDKRFSLPKAATESKG